MLRAPLFQFKHGDHICVFYRSQEALMGVLTPYIAEGLRKREKCFCVQKPRIVRQLLYDLQFIGIDGEAEIARGALEFHSESEAYLPTGKFEPAAMMEMLSTAIADAVQRGFTGFRSAGELSWAVEGRNECDQLIGYEELVKKSYPGQPATGLCQYPISAFPPNVLEAVLEKHQLSIIEPSNLSFFNSLGIHRGPFSAEIVADRFVTQPKYSYVVERRYPSEVLSWGVAPDFESARSEVEKELELASA